MWGVRAAGQAASRSGRWPRPSRLSNGGSAACCGSGSRPSSDREGSRSHPPRTASHPGSNGPAVPIAIIKMRATTTADPCWCSSPNSSACEPRPARPRPAQPSPEPPRGTCAQSCPMSRFRFGHRPDHGVCLVRHFLGFRLRLDPQTGTVEVLLSERTKRNAMERVRQLTPRNWGSSLASCITQINAWVRGWHGFFGIASASEMQMMRKLDAHIRRRTSAEHRAGRRGSPQSTSTRRAACNSLAGNRERKDENG